MTEILVAALVRFVRSIAVLALPAEGQLRWLNSLGLPGKAAVADELAHEFDDGFLLLSQFVERGWITGATVERLRELDSLLASMSGSENADLWDLSALESADMWRKVRDFAAGVLHTF